MTLEQPVFAPLFKFHLSEVLHPHDEAAVNFLKCVTAALENLVARFMAVCALRVSKDLVK